MPRRRAANARRHVVVDFESDYLGAVAPYAFAAWDTRARRGVLSQAVIGESEPSRTFGGDLGRPLQGFMGGLGAVGTPLQFRDGTNTLDKQTSDEAIDNPAMRLFAERLRRRR